MIAVRALWERFGRSHRIILTNSSSIIGTSAVISVLGAVYWLIAARMFPPSAVGLGAAIVSAMMLLASFANLGLSTLLVVEFPKHRGREGAVISTALLLTGLAALALGGIFAIASRWLPGGLHSLAQDPLVIALFAFGVALTAVTTLLDDAFIGLLRGGIQLNRNIVYSVGKLVAIAAVAIFAVRTGGTGIYVAWGIGNLLSLAVLVLYGVRHHAAWRSYSPDWSLVRGVKKLALGHYWLNNALMAPGMILPLLVTSLLTTELNAAFYLAWMVTRFVFLAPRSLTSALYAAGAAEPEKFAEKMRFTLRVSALLGIAVAVPILLGANLLLYPFGHGYSHDAANSLRLLTLCVFPLIVENHYVAICRIRGRVNLAALVMTMTGGLELVLAGVGARIMGLNGVSLGWLIGMIVEVMVIAPTVVGALSPRERPVVEPAVATESLQAG